MGCKVADVVDFFYVKSRFVVCISKSGDVLLYHIATSAQARRLTGISSLRCNVIRVLCFREYCLVLCLILAFLQSPNDGRSVEFCFFWSTV